MGGGGTKERARTYMAGPCQNKEWGGEKMERKEGRDGPKWPASVWCCQLALDQTVQEQASLTLCTLWKTLWRKCAKAKFFLFSVFHILFSLHFFHLGPSLPFCYMAVYLQPTALLSRYGMESHSKGASMPRLMACDV